MIWWELRDHWARGKGREKEAAKSSSFWGQRRRVGEEWAEEGWRWLVGEAWSSEAVAVRRAKCEEGSRDGRGGWSGSVRLKAAEEGAMSDGRWAMGEVHVSLEEAEEGHLRVRDKVPSGCWCGEKVGT